MKIIFLFALAIGHAISDKLDRTYLPPPGSQYSGGTVGDLETPFEISKQYYTTAGPQPGFPGIQSSSGGPKITQDTNSNGITVPTQYDNNFTPSTVRPERIFNIPTTTTSYAFSQTTTYSPIRDSENVINYNVGDGQNSDFAKFEPQNQNQVVDRQYAGQPSFIRPSDNQKYEIPIGNQGQPESNMLNLGKPDLGTLTPFQNNQEKIVDSHQQSLSGLSVQNVPLDQNKLTTSGSPDFSIPNEQSLKTVESSRQFSASPNKFVNDGKINGVPINTPNFYQGASELPSENVPVEYSNIKNNNAPNIYQSQPSKQSNNYVNNNLGPNDTKNYNTESSGLTPTSGTPSIGIVANEQYQSPGSISSNRPGYSTTNEIVSPNYVPGQFIGTSPSDTLGYPGSSNIKTPVINKIRPERPQAESDRNAVILKYENILTPEGFSYSFDTSNGIHADESGTAVDGVRAQGAYSYIGDDGKEYSVIYSADENGFLPRGDHLPTPPPIPEAILRVIEQAKKNKEAGIFEDGSYDDNKYGYKKYQGPVENYQPTIKKGSKSNVQNKQILKSTNGINSNKNNKEDTIDYIEEDVNDSSDKITSNQYLGVPNGRPIFPSQENNYLNNDNGITVEDQKVTIGINRRPGPRVPIKKLGQYGVALEDNTSGTGDASRGYNRRPGPQIPIIEQGGNKADQSVGTLDDFGSVRGSNKQKTSQNMNQSNEQNPNITPLNTAINNYGIRMEQSQLPGYQGINGASSIPKGTSNQQIQTGINAFRPVQNMYKIDASNGQSTVPKENNKQLYNPSRNGNLDRDIQQIFDQNRGYDYSAPKKPFGLTQNNQTTTFNTPQLTGTLSSVQQSTINPFVTPILNSNEESEENSNDSGEKFHENSYPNGETTVNKFGQPQFIKQKHPQVNQANKVSFQTSLNEYLPGDKNYNVQASRPASEVPATSITSTTQEYATTYRPTTVSVPFDISFNSQTTPTIPPSATIKQSEFGAGKRYPTTTYRPNYFIQPDNQVNDQNFPSVDINGRPIATFEQPKQEYNIQSGIQQPTSQLPSNQKFTPILSQNKQVAESFGRPLQVHSNQASDGNGSTLDYYGTPTLNSQNNADLTNNGFNVAPDLQVNREPNVDKYGRPILISHRNPQTAENSFDVANGGPKGAAQLRPTQGYQGNETHSYPVESTVTVDKFGRPLGQPGQQNQDRAIFSVPSNLAPKNSFNQPGSIKYQPAPAVPQVTSTQYINPNRPVVGEDFSGPKQQQRFDPETGYHY